MDLKHIFFNYNNNFHPFLFEDFSIAFEEGKITCILGPNACGKTTLLKLIAGLYKAQSGEIDFGSNIAYAPAEPDLFEFLTVEKNLEYCIYIKKTKEEKQQLILDGLELFNISNLSNLKPPSLSSGQTKKVILLRSLLNQANVILLDEPESHLDSKGLEEVKGILLDYKKKTSASLIIVTHSVIFATKIADRIVVLGGRPLQVLKDYNLEIDQNLRSDESYRDIFFDVMKTLSLVFWKLSGFSTILIF